jgi:hypothetical protein
MPPTRTARTNSPETSGRSKKTERVEPKRINVAVTPETVRALEALIEREGVSLTEAVRRLIGYGEFVYKAIKEQNSEVLVKSKDGSTREIVLL